MTPETILKRMWADGVRLTLGRGNKIKAIGEQYASIDGSQ
jgi:hypothetical protein